METPHDRSDYYLAYQHRFNALASRVDQLLETAANRTVAVQMPGDTAPQLTEGVWSDSDMLQACGDAGIEISEEEARELAKAENKKQRSIAALEVGMARGHVAMTEAAEYADANPPGEDFDVEELFARYPQAQWIQADFQANEGLSVILSSTHLSSPAAPGEEKSVLKITADDGSLSQQLFLERFGNTLRHVSFRVGHTGDELVDRCVRILGAQHAQALILMAARFEDEAELDAVLNELWADLQTTAAEEEAGYLLDEVRQRSLAAKHANELHADHGLGLPDQDKLAEFERLLE